jgi:hypothetical protein
MFNFRKVLAVLGTASFVFALSATSLKALSSPTTSTAVSDPSLLISYWVNETFSVNPTTGAITPTGLGSGLDDTIYIVNDGYTGGNLCADIYVWDPSEEEVSCCSVSITPNELVTEKVGGLLTNPASSRDRTPHSGVIKIIGSTSCDPTQPVPSPGLLAWMVHYFKNGSGVLDPTEEAFQGATLSAGEEALDVNACKAFAFLSGAGSCTGPVEAPAIVHKLVP